MNDIARREFLKFIGATATAVSFPSLAEAYASKLWFTPVRLPAPMPIYKLHPNWLATGLDGQGYELPATKSPELATYSVIDDVIVPPEYERYVIARWGDRVFPNRDDYFGYNNDHTGYVPIFGNWDGLLVVNHEYTSYPFHQLCPGTNTAFGTADPGPENRTFEAATDLSLPSVGNINSLTDSDRRKLYGEQCYNMGLSVIRIRRHGYFGHLRVVSRDERNRRVHLLSGLGINKDRTDDYKTVTSWGPTDHEQGTFDYLIGTGPAAKDVFEGIDTDGLGRKIIGTAFNCSGGVTPWGTVFSAEENFQGSIALDGNQIDLSSSFYIGVQEEVKPDGTQTSYVSGTVGDEFGLVGEKYGWIVEIDPRDASSYPKKHTALGRFRHENIAVRAEAGSRLVCYMGDDRRGGHWYKFVSTEKIDDLRDPSNSELFEEGTLYVARFATDGTGTWIPLELDTKTNPPRPSDLVSRQVELQPAPYSSGTNGDRNGLCRLPKRSGVAGQTTDGGFFGCTTLNEASAFVAYPAGYLDTTLASFYTSKGAILCDAFAAANLVGGTPAARPEDCEVHPYTKEVFLTHTDGAAGSDGYADSRLFTVAKYKSDINAAQQFGCIFRLTEDSADGSGTSFTWNRFTESGEMGTAQNDAAQPEVGVGYANADNMCFDKSGNVWSVTDMSTGLHNGVGDGPTPAALTVNHDGVGSGASAGGNLVGVFGNNWMFVVPVSGPFAGFPVPFAIGPTRCEMTGPSFIGRTLVISVQHPGEDSPTRAALEASPTFTRDIKILSSDGASVFTQTRSVPVGSQWPGNVSHDRKKIARPAVIGIERRHSHWGSQDPWNND
jgi:secreted PhoX family phosphatase